MQCNVLRYDVMYYNVLCGGGGSNGMWGQWYVGPNVSGASGVWGPMAGGANGMCGQW